MAVGRWHILRGNWNYQVPWDASISRAGLGLSHKPYFCKEVASGIQKYMFYATLTTQLSRSSENGLLWFNSFPYGIQHETLRRFYKKSAIQSFQTLKNPSEILLNQSSENIVRKPSGSFDCWRCPASIRPIQSRNVNQ